MRLLQLFDLRKQYLSRISKFALWLKKMPAQDRKKLLFRCRYLFDHAGRFHGRQSQIPVDIIINAVDKDQDVLPLTIESVRTHVKHPIQNIYVVAPPNSQGIQAVADEHRCVFVDENSLFNFTPRDINYIVEPGIDRSGWLFQQLAKLHGGIGTEEYFVTIDADTLLITDRVFERRGYPIFFQRSVCNSGYYKAYQKLFGYPHTSYFSFVTHMMCFRKSWLAEMKTELEQRHGIPWQEAILKLADPQEWSCFSEFVTYGNWVVAHKRAYTCAHHNVMLPRTALSQLKELEADDRYTRFASISFQHYHEQDFGDKQMTYESFALPYDGR
jgi:hypothetical protein